MGFMKAAVLHAPGELRIEQAAFPGELQAGEVLVQVKAAGICGSDIDRIRKSGTYRFPLVPGHEFCGVVEKVGEGVTFSEGDRVVVAPIIPCRQCEFCQRGNYGQCIDYDYLGSRRDGAFAQYVVAPAANLIRMPEGMDFIEGAMVEPAAVALHGMRKVGINAGDCVAVLGCGAIGLLALQFAKILGATRVIAADIDPDKLALARALGADVTIHSGECDALEEIKRLTNGRGVDVAVETAGVPVTQTQCIEAAMNQGRVLFLGTAHRDIVISAQLFEHIIRGELTMVGSWNSYSAPFPGADWTATLAYIVAGKLQLRPLVSHIIALEALPETMERMEKRTMPFNKIVVEL